MAFLKPKTLKSRVKSPDFIMINKIKTRYLAEFVAFVIMFFIFAGPVLASEITTGKVIDLVNMSREKEGLKPLTQSESLMKIANDKLNDMIKNNYFAHTSPAGKNPWHWFSKNGYDYQYAGENLAINFVSAEKQHSAWMDSITHKKNILNHNYKEIGVAFGAGEIDGQLALITVQEFGTRFRVAGESSEKDNFSAEGDKSLIKEEEKIVPQILSIKNQELQNTVSDRYLGNEEYLPKQVWIDPSIKYATDRLKMVDWMSFVSMLFFFASLSLLPLAFLAVAFDKMIILHETRKRGNQVLI